MTGRRSRGRWIAILCAAVAVCVGAAGISEAVRFLRERRAIRALGSDVAAERIAALQELASIGTSRALRGILSSLPMSTSEAEGLFIEAPSGETYSWEPDSESWELRCAVAIYYGKYAVPLLRSLLRSREPPERYWALRFLWRIPELTPEAPGPTILDLLDDPDPRVRGEAVLAVAMSAPTLPSLLDRLIEELGDVQASGRSRAAAAKALSLAATREPKIHGSKTTTARAAAGALMAAAGDDVIAVRAECARGLCDIEERCSYRDLALARAIQQFLVARLGEPDPEIREVLAAHLADRAAIPALIHALERGPPDARPGVVEILRSMDWFDDRCILPLLEHEDWLIRSQAAKALAWSVNIEAGRLEQTVLELLAEARTDLLRRMACETAPSLGPAAVKAVPLLAALIEAEPWDGRPSAAQALGDIGAGARAALPSLAAAARGRDPDLAVEAIRALSKVSPDGCAEVIASGLRHGDGRVRDAALCALWSLESRATPALASLRQAAADGASPDFARRAAELVSLLESR